MAGVGRSAGVQVRERVRSRGLDLARDLFRGVDAVVHLAFKRPRGPASADRYLAERANIDMAYAIYQLALDEESAGRRRQLEPRRRFLRDACGTSASTSLSGRARPLPTIFTAGERSLWSILDSLRRRQAGPPSGGRADSVGAPRDLATTTFAGPSQNDPLTLHRDLAMWVSPRDLAQLFVRSIDAQQSRTSMACRFRSFMAYLATLGRAGASPTPASRRLRAARQLGSRLRRRNPALHRRASARRRGQREERGARATGEVTQACLVKADVRVEHGRGGKTGTTPASPRQSN